MSLYNQKFERKDRDYYPTIDPDALPEKFLEFIDGKEYWEPCAGDGSLDYLIEKASALNTYCVQASDIEPQDGTITPLDALEITKEMFSNSGADCFITNPPFSKKLLFPLLDHLPNIAPTWLLLRASTLHNKRMKKYWKNCSQVVSIGRLGWFRNVWLEDSTVVIKTKEGAFKDRENYTGWYNPKLHKITSREFDKGMEDFIWAKFHSGEWKYGTRFYA